MDLMPIFLLIVTVEVTLALRNIVRYRTHRTESAPGSWHVNSVNDNAENSSQNNYSVKDHAYSCQIAPIHIYAEAEIEHDKCNHKYSEKCAF